MIAMMTIALTIAVTSDPENDDCSVAMINGTTTIGYIHNPARLRTPLAESVRISRPRYKAPSRNPTINPHQPKLMNASPGPVGLTPPIDPSMPRIS